MWKTKRTTSGLDLPQKKNFFVKIFRGGAVRRRTE